MDDKAARELNIRPCVNFNKKSNRFAVTHGCSSKSTGVSIKEIHDVSKKRFRSQNAVSVIHRSPKLCRVQIIYRDHRIVIYFIFFG